MIDRPMTEEILAGEVVDVALRNFSGGDVGAYAFLHKGIGHVPVVVILIVAGQAGCCKGHGTGIAEI